MLVDVVWHHNFSEAFIETLSRLYAHHHPILLRCEGLGVLFGPRPFLFRGCLDFAYNYEAIVANARTCQNDDVLGRLVRVKEYSLIFNKNVFRNNFRRKRSLENRLRGVQEKLERVDLASLSILERDLQKEYGEVLK